MTPAFIFLSLLVASLANAAWDTKTEAFLTSRYRSFEETPFARNNQDNFGYLKQEFIYSNDSLRFQASPFILLENSQTVQLLEQKGDPILTPIASGHRKLDLETRNDADERTQSVFDFQELFLSYNQDAVSLDVGRRILSLGNLKLLSGWNKFNPSGASFRPTWLKGVDQFKLTVEKENTKVIGYSIHETLETRDARLIQIDHFASPFQLSLLGGDWWEAKTLGLALTVDVAGWLLKFESLNFKYFKTQKNREEETQVGGGFERSFAQDWNINFEFFTQSQGAGKKEDYKTHNLSPHQALHGKTYVASELKWTPNPFYTYSALALFSTIDSSSLQGMTATHQWNENVEVGLGFLVPSGKGEFSPKFAMIAPGKFQGAPSQVDLTLKMFY